LEHDSLIEQARCAEAEPLMVAAANGLDNPLPGQQNRKRIANRARLVTLHEKLGRSRQADIYR
jgi:hypothetical protein